jgi:hypothetical protein
MRNGTSRHVTLLIVVDSISLGFAIWMPTICISSMLVFGPQNSDSLVIRS